MCQCDNCEFQDWQLGRAMDRRHQMLQKMTHLFESLPPFQKFCLHSLSMIQNSFLLKPLHVQLFLINLGIWKMKLILAAVVKAVTNTLFVGSQLWLVWLWCRN